MNGHDNLPLKKEREAQVQPHHTGRQRDGDSLDSLLTVFIPTTPAYTRLHAHTETSLKAIRRQNAVGV